MPSHRNGNGWFQKVLTLDSFTPFFLLLLIVLLTRATNGRILDWSKNQEEFCFMRFSFCKIHWPSSFICFCKPSTSIYRPGPLKLENSPYVPSVVVVSVADANADKGDAPFDKDDESRGEAVVVGVDGKQWQGQTCLKSSLKKADLDAEVVEEEEEKEKKKKKKKKKRVQWVDFLGKQLVEIREFQPSEAEYVGSEEHRNRSCVCAIL